MIGQPKDYSEMLKRIFMASLIVGIICTLSLAYKSPAIKTLINLSPENWDLGYVALPIVAVAIPFFVAIIARIITLHNLISKIFKIRLKFDDNQILLPLATGAGIVINQELLAKIRDNRYELMRDTFYKYAPNVENSIINSQFVATALDRWAWFWCFIEPTIIFLLSAIVAWWQIGFKYSLIYFGAIIVFIIVSIFIYPSCKSAAKYEVDDILNDNDRKTTIAEAFNAL